MVPSHVWNAAWRWCKKEIVLTAALILAAASAFFVRPDGKYIGYIDFRTLAILFCLMTVTAGLRKCGIFSCMAEALLRRVRRIRSMAFILVMLCFFSSMLITNDVALLTFVPFTLVVLGMVFPRGADRFTISLVAMQTIAANLGSMLTPIGNPQNLYLYERSGMGPGAFLHRMLPYSGAAFALLALWCLLFRSGENGIAAFPPERRTALLSGSKKQIGVYAGLFALSLLTVGHVIPCPATFLITVLAVLRTDRETLRHVDYSLLLTFVGFFIFVGNMGRIPAFHALMARMTAGNEVLAGVIASQVLSNVPTALLLSGFTDQYAGLIVGVNLGGLGSLIASMASLISFKCLGSAGKALRGRYLLYFTAANLVFLAVLLGVWAVI